MNKKTKIVFHLYYSDWSCSPSSSTITICDYTPPGSLCLHALASECTRISYIRACQYISFPPSSDSYSALKRRWIEGGRKRLRRTTAATEAGRSSNSSSRWRWRQSSHWSEELRPLFLIDRFSACTAKRIVKLKPIANFLPLGFLVFGGSQGWSSTQTGGGSGFLVILFGSEMAKGGFLSFPSLPEDFPGCGVLRAGKVP